MTAQEKLRQSSTVPSFLPTGRILLLLLCVCGIVLNRPAGTENAAAQSNGPTKCDSGMLRHSLHAAALTEKPDIASTPSPDRDTAPLGMVWIPGGRFWMRTEHMEDAQPVHQVE